MAAARPLVAVQGIDGKATEQVSSGVMPGRPP